LVSIDSLIDYIHSSAKKLNIDLKDYNFWSFDQRTWFNNNVCNKSESQDITEHPLWNQFKDELKNRLIELTSSIFYSILKKLLLLETKEAKEAFISDIYVSLNLLILDRQQVEGATLPMAQSTDPMSVICCRPFDVLYFRELGYAIFEISDNVAKRFSMHISEGAKQAVVEQSQDYLYPIGSASKTGNEKQMNKQNSPFLLIWKRNDNDLIELATALDIAKCVSTLDGKLPRQKLVNVLTAIFGLEKFADQKISDKAGKVLRRKGESAKFLKVLLNAYEGVSKVKKKIPRKKPAS
jgi:hypothetical protein